MLSRGATPGAAGLAGASVLRGIEGFGASSRIHTSRLLSLSEDLPVAIVVVDVDERIRAFLPQLDDLVTEGLVIIDPVEGRQAPSRPAVRRAVGRAAGGRRDLLRTDKTTRRRRNTAARVLGDGEPQRRARSICRRRDGPTRSGDERVVNAMPDPRRGRYAACGVRVSRSLRSP
jgi:uncharacterized protein